MNMTLAGIRPLDQMDIINLFYQAKLENVEPGPFAPAITCTIEDQWEYERKAILDAVFWDSYTTTAEEENHER